MTVSSEVCAQCGKSFSSNDMVKFENSWVCQFCKPIFLQKLKEGVSTSKSLTYGGFWIRFGAKIIDGILLQIVNYAVLLPVMALMGFKRTAPTAAGIAGIAGAYILIFGFNIAYITFFLGKFGATPGKMACRLKVINPDGSKISYLKAFGRYWGELLSAFTLSIGYLMAAWDTEKRALHDRVCNTRVVKVV